MSKKISKNNDEINLFLIINILWHSKWIIVFLTIITTSIGYIYSSQIKPSYKVSTTIKLADRSVFVKYTTLNDILFEAGIFKNDTNLNGYSIDSESIFQLFIREFQDYNELISVLEKNPIVQKKIINLNKEDKIAKLLNIAKAFKIYIPSRDDDDGYRLNYTWGDKKEGQQILNDTILLVLKNVKKTIVKDIENLALSIDMKNKQLEESLKLKLKLLFLNQKKKDQAQIQYLKEQSAIAEELGFEENRLDSYTLPQNASDGGNTSLSINSNKVPYYLRGTKAINKEISLIEKRTPDQRLLTTDEYFIIQRSLIEIQSNLSSSKLIENLNTLQMENIADWVDYRFFLGSVKTLNNFKLYIMMSVFFGLILGVFYVLIFHSYQNYKSLKK